MDVEEFVTEQGGQANEKSTLAGNHKGSGRMQDRFRTCCKDDLPSCMIKRLLSAFLGDLGGADMKAAK